MNQSRCWHWRQERERTSKQSDIVLYHCRPAGGAVTGVPVDFKDFKNQILKVIQM